MEKETRLETARTGSYYELFCVSGASWYFIDDKFGINYAGKRGGRLRISIIANTGIPITRETAKKRPPSLPHPEKVSMVTLSLRKSENIYIDNSYTARFLQEGTVRESAHLALESTSPANIQLFSNPGEISDILNNRVNSRM